MAYCTIDDILDCIDEDEVIGYTDDHDAGLINQEAVDRAISVADAQIDLYLGRRYQVPMDPVPDQVRHIAVDIAIFRICSRRNQAPDDRRQKYDDAVKQLKDIAAGTGVIPGAVATEPETSGEEVVISSQPQQYSGDVMDGF